MRVFVLSTGRCGSMTFARACGHMTNFTSGHELNVSEFGAARLAYPDDHIENDQRLAWFLGPLDARYGSSARYVHLTREPDAVVESFLRRWPGYEPAHQSSRSRYVVHALKYLRYALMDRKTVVPHDIGIIGTFAHGIVARRSPWPPEAREQLCRDYVATVNANIDLFLRDKPHVMHVKLASARDDFARFWDWVGAEGDRSAALEEWTVRHNASV